jgi:hypothetical protein
MKTILLQQPIKDPLDLSSVKMNSALAIRSLAARLVGSYDYNDFTTIKSAGMTMYIEGNEVAVGNASVEINGVSFLPGILDECKQQLTAFLDNNYVYSWKATSQRTALKLMRLHENGNKVACLLDGMETREEIYAIYQMCDAEEALLFFKQTGYFITDQIRDDIIWKLGPGATAKEQAMTLLAIDKLNDLHKGLEPFSL